MGGTLVFTAVQADRLARSTIDAGLKETRDVWQAIQADRFNKLKLGVRVLANDPYFKAALGERDQATTLDSLGERGQDLGADFMMATDPAGALVARTDRPSASGDDLSADPIVRRALEGEDSATLWRQGDQLFTAVAVPMQTGPELVGVLVAGYGLNEAVASQIRRLTHSEIAFLVQAPGQQARLAVSSLGPREGALAAAVSRPELAGADDGALRDRPRRRPPHRRADTAEGGGRRGDRRRPRPAQPLRGDRLLPPVPQQPRPRVPRGHGPGAPRRLGRRRPDHRPGAEAGVGWSSGSARAPTPGRSRSRAATRSASSPARSTGSSPTCARRTR